MAVVETSERERQRETETETDRQTDRQMAETERQRWQRLRDKGTGQAEVFHRAADLGGLVTHKHATTVVVVEGVDVLGPMPCQVRHHRICRACSPCRQALNRAVTMGFVLL